MSRCQGLMFLIAILVVGCPGPHSGSRGDLPLLTLVEDTEWPGSRIALYDGVHVTEGPSNSILVSDVGNNVVFWISRGGELLQEIGRSGYGPGEFSHPSESFYDDDLKKLWIADRSQGRLTTYCLKEGTFRLESTISSQSIWGGRYSSGLVVTHDSTLVIGARSTSRAAYVIDLVSGEPIGSFGDWPLPEDKTSTRDLCMWSVLAPMDSSRIALAWLFQPRLDIWNARGENLQTRILDFPEIEDIQARSKRTGQNHLLAFTAGISGGKGIGEICYHVWLEDLKQAVFYVISAVDLEPKCRLKAEVEAPLGPQSILLANESDGTRVLYIVDVYSGSVRRFVSEP